MFCPVVEARRLVRLVFGANCGQVIESDESVLVGVDKHAAVSLMEYVSGPLHFELNWGVHFGFNFVILSISALLVVVISCCVTFECCSHCSRPAPESSIERWLVLLCVSPVITSIHIVQVVRLLFVAAYVESSSFRALTHWHQIVHLRPHAQ